MIRVIIADDHAVVRRGLKEIVEEQSDMEVVGEAQNCQEALRLLRQQDLDVVVLDINMPGGSGLEVLAEIRQSLPRLKVLILSGYPEDQLGMRALKAGAMGYLTKESAPEELVRAIRKVNGGGKYVTPVLAEKLAEALGPGASETPHEKLTDREFQIFRLLASGKRVTEIADELSISVKTVSTLRSRIMKKMRFSSNADLIRYALTNQIEG